MIDIDKTRAKILNDLQRQVVSIIDEDDIKNVQERDEVIAYFEQAIKLSKKWGVFDLGEYEHNFEMDRLRINPSYRGEIMAQVNRRRRIANWSGKPYSEVKLNY
tara:strand:+ start:212 stop:523 length:312 start_codon:yes stop_codon:yes gene_type:complete